MAATARWTRRASAAVLCSWAKRSGGSRRIGTAAASEATPQDGHAIWNGKPGPTSAQVERSDAQHGQSVQGTERSSQPSWSSPLRGCDCGRELRRRERQLRPCARVVRGGLRRPERARLRRAPPGRRLRPGCGAGWSLRVARAQPVGTGARWSLAERSLRSPSSLAMCTAAEVTASAARSRTFHAIRMRRAGRRGRRLCMPSTQRTHHGPADR
jgi:hypothetical protein